MTKRERAALRKSIYRVAVESAIEHLYIELIEDLELSGRDDWMEERGNTTRRWKGPEVTEECRNVYPALVRALQVARTAADRAALKESPR